MVTACRRQIWVTAFWRSATDARKTRLSCWPIKQLQAAWLPRCPYFKKQMSDSQINANCTWYMIYPNNVGIEFHQIDGFGTWQPRTFCIKVSPKASIFAVKTWHVKRTINQRCSSSNPTTSRKARGFHFNNLLTRIGMVVGKWGCFVEQLLWLGLRGMKTLWLQQR